MNWPFDFVPEIHDGQIRIRDDRGVLLDDFTAKAYLVHQVRDTAIAEKVEESTQDEDSWQFLLLDNFISYCVSRGWKLWAIYDLLLAETDWNGGELYAIFAKAMLLLGSKYARELPGAFPVGYNKNTGWVVFDHGERVHFDTEAEYAMHVYESDLCRHSDWYEAHVPPWWKVGQFVDPRGFLAYCYTVWRILGNPLGVLEDIHKEMLDMGLEKEVAIRAISFFEPGTALSLTRKEKDS